MTDQLKAVVQELGKPPFSRNYNLITFDSLEPIQLLQVLSDVLTTVQNEPSIDIRDEAAEETAFRLLTIIRLLKFPSPTEPEQLNEFRQGLVAGDKHVIYPLLLWIFARVSELQKRLYLARFLVKVDVPPEFLQDVEVEELNQRCDALMEDFKAVHKANELYQMDGATSEDIRQDIKSMELERDQVTKRIEKVKKKVEHAPQKGKMMELARNLRLESDREFQLSHQKQEQRNALVHAEQKAQRLSQEIKEILEGAENHDPSEVVKRLEDETQTQAYLANEKLPKEIELKRKTVQELQKVLSMPALDEKDISELQEKIGSRNNEINQLIEQRNMKFDPSEDKVAVYRQQAAMVTRKKETTAEKLQQARIELEDAQRELTNKKSLYRDDEGNEIITQTQFKNYLAVLRNKSTVYKRKRQEINDLKAEVGVLIRTSEILANQATANGAEVRDDVQLEDDAVFTSHAVSLEGKSGDEAYQLAKTTQQEVLEKRNTTNGIVNELKPVRADIERLTDELESAKKLYNTTASNLEGGFAALQETVKRLTEQLSEDQSTMFRLDAEKIILDAQLERADAEANGGEQQPYRTLLQSKIQQSDAAAKKLKAEQTKPESKAISAKQLKLWKDLAVIMEHKKRNLLRHQQILRDSVVENRHRCEGKVACLVVPPLFKAAHRILVI